MAGSVLTLPLSRPLRKRGRDCETDVFKRREPRQQRVILKHNRGVRPNAASSLDLPQPMVPRIDTNSPRSTESDTSARTSSDEPPAVTNVFATCEISMNAIRFLQSSGHSI